MLTKFRKSLTVVEAPFRWIALGNIFACFIILESLAPAVPVAFGMTRVIPIFGQIVHAQGLRPQFDVISVRQSDRDAPSGGIQMLGDGIIMRGMPLKTLIMWAYNIAGDSQFSGGPGWIQSTRFDIQAKVDEARATELSKLTPEQRKNQMLLMAQSLLEVRFKLKVSFPMREQAVYELTVAKDGLKCPKADLLPAAESFLATPSGFVQPPPPPPPPAPPTSPEAARGAAAAAQLHLPAAPMWFFASLLSHEPELDGHIVQDKTGVDGIYKFDLSWSRDSADSPSPSLFTALPEQLGLKLTPTRGQVEVLVIDHIEQPLPN